MFSFLPVYSFQELEISQKKGFRHHESSDAYWMQGSKYVQWTIPIIPTYGSHFFFTDQQLRILWEPVGSDCMSIFEIHSELFDMLLGHLDGHSKMAHIWNNTKQVHTSDEIVATFKQHF